MPVTADVCHRAACQVAQWQRACSQRCIEAGRLGRKSGLFSFLHAGVIAWKGDALGIFPMMGRCHCWWRSAVSPTLPTSIFLVKPKAVKSNQALFLFTLKMLLSLNYRFKWLLKRTPEGLQVLPDAGEPGKLFRERTNTSRGSFLFFIQGKPATHISNSRFPHLLKTGFCI